MYHLDNRNRVSDYWAYQETKGLGLGERSGRRRIHLARAFDGDGDGGGGGGSHRKCGNTMQYAV